MVTDSTADQVVDSCQGGANWRETQWMRSEAPMRLAVGAIVLLCCFGFLVDDRDRMIYPILGAVYLLLFWFTRLTVEVSSEAILIRYVPLVRRSIPLADVKDVQVRYYSPYLYYRGSVMRPSLSSWWGKHSVYGLRSDRCVELELGDGRMVTVGSKRAAELAAVLASHLESR